MTPEEKAALEADIAFLDGTSSSVEENNEINTTTETPAAIEAEETTDEDEDESQEETIIEETDVDKPVKTEEQIRKEVEKELRKKYLSQVNKKDKETKELKAQLESLKDEGYDDAQIEAVRKIVRAENATSELSRIEKIEKSSFVKKFAPDSKEMEGIEDIREDFPTMSWEAARRFYLSEKSPETLIKAKPTNLGLSGDTHKDVVNKPDNTDELMAKIIAEANFMAGRG